MKQLIFCLFLTLMTSCSSNSSRIVLTGSVEEALALIKGYNGEVANFKLGLKSELTFGKEVFPFSAAMAVITDAILKKGWTLNGSEEVKGGKIYFYKKME